MQICEALYNMMAEGDRIRDEGLVMPDEVEIVSDIAYGEDKKWQLLDVFRPKKREGLLPVIFNVHGGGWVYGDKDLYRFYCAELAKEGFVVVSFSYRLTPQIAYPEHLHDVNSAMKWTALNIAEYGGNIKRLGIIGDSAGGEMAAMYTCALINPQCREKLGLCMPDVKIKATVLNCSVCDIEEGMRGIDERMSEEQREELISAILGADYSEEEKLLGRPCEFITADFPVSYIMTSNGDFLRHQQHLLTEALTEKGVSFEYHEYGDKSEMLWHVFHCNIRSEAAKICNKSECDFFRKHL